MFFFLPDNVIIFFSIFFLLQQELELEEWITDDDMVEGFLYKPGPKRSTTGIWMWAEPILIDVPNGDRYAVILVGQGRDMGLASVDC